jgi:acyl-CoA synthetase (AMP-forming)/AMP-acid ligase II
MAGAAAVRRPGASSESAATAFAAGGIVTLLDLRYALVLNGDPLALDFTPLTLQRAAGDSTLPWREERLASMTLTSGSTGLPKAAPCTAVGRILPAPKACWR